MTRTMHAAAFVKCTDGHYRQFHTLCGINAHPNGEAPSPLEVTCKSCRKSRAWGHSREALTRPMVCGFCRATIPGGMDAMREHIRAAHNGNA